MSACVRVGRVVCVQAFHEYARRLLGWVDATATRKRLVMPTRPLFPLPSGADLAFQQRRQEPANGMHPLSKAKLAACRAALEPHWLAGTGPVMLSSATSVPNQWLLGLSVAKHGLPLVLVGLNQPRWPWWQGGRKKLPGSRRALQVIHELSPNRPVIFSDTGTCS